MCELRSPAIALQAEEGVAVAEFTLSRGERASFVLAGHLPGPAWDEDAVQRSFQETVKF